MPNGGFDVRRTKLLSLILSISLMIGLINVPVVNADNLLAFPGAEGGGKYTTGARGKSSRTVYHVTNLNDNGAGSLRDAVSGEGRIVVFDVSGVIKLDSRLDLRKPNITILGQTAPGDGITISGYDVLIAADNIIMRYLRIRPTDSQNGEPDGLGGRWIDNIIIDHCSVSWGVDEMLTVYSGSLENGKEAENLDPKVQSTNVTVQYCLSSESLRMSSHFKGAHGYGGIIGGTNASYHHNMFAHHDSRNPRMDRNLKSTDMVNNVIYNWGNNSVYGAEPYSYNKWERYSAPEYASHVNMRNNYYKYGPSTKASVRSKIFEATNSGDAYYNDEMAKSYFYINGNYVYGNAEATANNTASESNVMNQDKLNLLNAPIDMGDYEIPEQSAEDAFEDVIANVGATLPRRDSIDARIVADAKNGTGRIINKIEEVGGFTGITSETRTFEIPSDWKTEHGMASSYKETDIVPAGEWAGYTWIEAYVNDWTQQQSVPTNPDITVISPAIADTSKSTDKTGGKGFWTTTTEDVPVSYIVAATAKTGTTISKIELYDGTTLIDTVIGGEINKSITLDAGTHYLTSKAYNNKGEITTSPTSVVYVTKNDNSIGNDTIEEIGTVPFPNDTNVWVNDGKTYIGGSGLINGKSDSFGYWKHHVTGDFEFSARIESVPKYENGALCGIMFRESLDADSRMIMLSDGWKKYGENIMVPQRLTTGGAMTLGYMKDSDGNSVENNSSYDTTDESLNLTPPKYMKIARKGDTLTLSVSNDGVTWTNNIRQPLEFDISDWSKDAYIGLAVDSINGSANDGSPMLPWYTIGAFSNIKMTGISPYSVSFETDGGQITNGGFTTYSYGDEKEMPSVEKTDLYFGGWYDNELLEGDTLDAMPKTAAGNQTYYVKWLESTPTPTPTPEPVYPDSWTASEADIGKSAGDELMTGLTLVSDNTSTNSSYVTNSANGKINDGEVSGSALKFVAKGDGTLSVTFYEVGGGNSKTIVIYDVESGTYAASYTTVKDVAETKELTAEVKRGKKYYIVGFGTKARYSAASFTPTNGSETPVESPTPAPTASAVPTATPTVAPTATPTVAPTATPTATPTVTPTVAPTATPTAIPSELKVEYDKEAKEAIITSPAQKTGTVIFASYENGRLVSVAVKTDVNIETGTNKIKVPENFAVTDTVKVYLWNSIRGLTPLK